MECHFAFHRLDVSQDDYVYEAAFASDIVARFFKREFPMVLDRRVTDVICAASVQHLHLRLETLPVGLIVVDQNAAIVSADEWSERLLGFSGKSEKGRSITTIFGEVAKSWIRALGKNEASYLGCLHLITNAGVRLKMEIAAAPSIAPHLNDLHIVFALDG